MDVVANSMGMSNEELADRKQNLKREQKVLLCLLDLSDRFISFFSKESCYSFFNYNTHSMEGEVSLESGHLKQL